MLQEKYCWEEVLSSSCGNYLLSKMIALCWVRYQPRINQILRILILLQICRRCFSFFASYLIDFFSPFLPISPCISPARLIAQADAGSNQETFIGIHSYENTIITRTFTKCVLWNVGGNHNSQIYWYLVTSWITNNYWIIMLRFWFVFPNSLFLLEHSTTALLEILLDRDVVITAISLDDSFLIVGDSRGLITVKCSYYRLLIWEIVNSSSYRKGIKLIHIPLPSLCWHYYDYDLFYLLRFGIDKMENWFII